MIVPKKYFNRNTHYVPDALASYPWLKNELKEREAIRMHAMFHYVNDNPDIFKDMGLIMVITPYTHLADSLKQLYEKFYTALGAFQFVTTRKSQGMTVYNVIFFNSYAPSCFVDDKQILVSWSRHKKNLFIMPFRITSMVPHGMLALLHVLRILHIDFLNKPVLIKKELMIRSFKISFRILDFERLKEFFFTKQFEKYRLLVNYPWLEGQDADNWRRHSGILSETAACFMDNPGRPLHFGGEGSFKHILFFFEKTEYTHVYTKYEEACVDNGFTLQFCFDGALRPIYAAGGISDRCSINFKPQGTAIVKPKVREELDERKVHRGRRANKKFSFLKGSKPPKNKAPSEKGMDFLKNFL